MRVQREGESVCVISVVDADVGTLCQRAVSGLCNVCASVSAHTGCSSSVLLLCSCVRL